MGVTITSKGVGFLQTVGVSKSAIDAMQAHNIKLTLGFNDFSFVNEEKEVLSKGVLPVSSNLLIKGATPKDKSAAAFALGEAIQKAIWASSPKEPEKKPSWALNPEKEIPKIVASAAPQTPQTVKAPMATGKEEVVALKDATKMYQRVRGSSKGSVYVTVAMTPNGDLKLAARIHGASLSVRAEGILSDKIKLALGSQGIHDKNGYASGHFNCGDVLMSRVMGAILLGSGIEFATPLPNMQKVKELSS